MPRAILCALAAALVGAASPSAALGAELSLYLNRSGGVFTPGQPNDSRTNISSVADSTVDLPPWAVDETGWQEVVTCVEELFAPFGVEVTEQDPGDAEHLEVVIGGRPTDLGLDPNAAGVSPFLSNCSVIDNSIVFVFPVVMDDSPRLVCEAIAQEAAHSLGLDHQFMCEDPMTYLTGCGEKRFQFRDSACGELEPRACRCSPTQNSAQLLLERVGAGPRPAMWLSEPTGTEPVARGFVVTTAVTHAPQDIALWVDGELYDRAPAVVEPGPYALVDLATFDLSGGSHELEVVARWADGTQLQESVAVEVLDPDANTGLLGGCRVAGGGGSSGAAALLALAAALTGAWWRPRRRPRRAPRRGR